MQERYMKELKYIMKVSSMWVYSSKNGLDQIDFHDCNIEVINIEHNKLILNLESVNVLSEHKLNPYDVAKNTDKCTLEFYNVESYESGIFDRNEETKTNIDLINNKDFEILKLDIIEEGKRNLYRIFGVSTSYNNEFSEIIIKAEYTIIKWNEYITDAWFVDWPMK